MTEIEAIAKAVTTKILVVELEISSYCNRACSYCPNHDGPRPRSRMEWSLFERIVDQLAGIRFRGRLSFHFYNEPLLDKRLADFVRHATDKLPGCRVKTFTNGDLLTPALFRRLVDAGVWKFKVTNHEGAENGVATRLVPFLEPHEREALELQEYDALNLSNRGGLIQHLTRGPLPLAEPCALPSARLVITAVGNVVLCAEDFLEREVVGNLQRQTIEEVWHSQRMSACRERLSKGDRRVSVICRSCTNTSYPRLLDH